MPRPLLYTSLLAILPSLGHAAYVLNLGTLTGTPTQTYATGVSADGSVVVGRDLSPSRTAFAWTPSSGMVALDKLPGYPSGAATGVSANGKTIVGGSDAVSGFQAFRWTEAEGTVGLGYLPGFTYGSSADAISSDGSTIVGTSSANAGAQAYRWTAANGMVGLGRMSPGLGESRATVVSGNGSVISGWDSSATTGIQAFRWTESTGMVSLGIPGTPWGAFPTAMSLDGATIVGEERLGGGVSRTFRWSATGGIDYLPMSSPLAIDSNGTVYGQFGDIVTPDGTLHSLTSILQNLGTNLDGWTAFAEIQDVTPDGRFLVGSGLYHGQYRAFLADLDPNATNPYAVPEPSTLAFLTLATPFLFRRRPNSLPA